MEHNPIKYSDLVKPDNSITDLIGQLTDLQGTYTKTLQSIKGEAIQLTASMKNVSGATEEGRKATRKAADDADRLAKEEKKLAEAKSENARRLAELKAAQKEANNITRITAQINASKEGSYNRLAAQYALNKIRINQMTEAERQNAEAANGLISRTRELYEQMKALQAETGQHQLNVGNYRDAGEAIAELSGKMQEGLGLSGKFGEAIMALGRGGEDAKQALSAIGDGAKALGNSLLTLMSNPVFLGIAGIAGAGAAFKWWYDYNAGLVEATRLTKDFTGKSGQDLKDYRNEVQAVAETYDKDFREVLTSANALSKQYGIDASEALQLIRDGFIAGADVTGEFLDNVKEYPAYFKEAGISASQFVAITAQANKQGVFSDKGVDAIKEANLRLREMTTSTAAALDGIGLSSAKVQEELQNGSKTTFEVMQEVSAKMAEFPESSAKIGSAIADIFGGPGEDAGLQYLLTLKDIETNLDNVKESAGELGRLEEEQLNAQIEFENALSELFDQTGGNFETMIANGKIFALQTLTAIVKGVINVINYFVQLYNDSDAFRVMLNSLQGTAKTFGAVFGNVLDSIIKQFKIIGTIAHGVFTGNFDEISKGLKMTAENFKGTVTKTMDDVRRIANEASRKTSKKIEPVKIPAVIETMTTGTAQTQTAGTATKVETKSGTKGAGAGAKAVEDAYKKNLEARRKYEDAVLATEQDAWKKRTQQTEYNFARQIEDLRHRLATEKDLTAEQRQSMNDTITALEVQQTQELTKIENERTMQELNAVKEGIELKLKAVKQGSEEEFELRKKLIEANRNIAVEQNRQRPEGTRQSEADVTASFDKEAGDLSDKYMQSQMQIFEQQQKLAQSEFDLLKTTEEKKTQFKLNAEKERLQKILELNQTANNKMSDAEVKTIENTIKRIENEIKDSEKDEQTKDLYGLFGLNLNDEQKESINTSVSYAIEALNTYMSAYAEMANRKVEQADKEVDGAQRVLEAEIQARANGYANNVTMAQKDLALAKKNQEKALKEQKKAQREQQIIDTATQTSSLITATAGIWKSFAGTGPWGIAAAVAATALMWGSFAFAKIKAAQMTKPSTETYGEGTIELLDGGSHQSGNDVDLGTKADGTKRRAEGGEFFAVINKRNSRRYRSVIPDLIHSLNDGTFESKYLSVYPTESLALNVSASPDLRSLSEDVREIKEQNRTRYFVDAKGNTYMTYKNLRRRTNG